MQKVFPAKGALPAPRSRVPRQGSCAHGHHLDLGRTPRESPIRARGDGLETDRRQSSVYFCTRLQTVVQQRSTPGIPVFENTEHNKMSLRASLVAQTVERLPAMREAKREDSGTFPGSRRSPGEGNGTPLQYSCLENSMDGGAWWATVHGVAKSRTWLSNFTSLHFIILPPSKSLLPRAYIFVHSVSMNFYIAVIKMYLQGLFSLL